MTTLCMTLHSPNAHKQQPCVSKLIESACQSDFDFSRTHLGIMKCFPVLKFPIKLNFSSAGGVTLFAKFSTCKELCFVGWYSAVVWPVHRTPKSLTP